MCLGASLEWKINFIALLDPIIQKSAYRDKKWPFLVTTMDFWDMNSVKISCFLCIKMILMLQNREITLRTSHFYPQKVLWIYVWKFGSDKKGGVCCGVKIVIQQRKLAKILVFRSSYTIYTPWTCATNILDVNHPFHHPFSNTFEVMNHHW